MGRCMRSPGCGMGFGQGMGFGGGRANAMRGEGGYRQRWFSAGYGETGTESREEQYRAVLERRAACLRSSLEQTEAQLKSVQAASPADQ